MLHVQSFRVPLYDLGVCRTPHGATVDLERTASGDQRVTVLADDDHWCFDVLDVAERRLDPGAIRHDGQLVSARDVPYWVEVSLERVGCRLQEREQ